MSLFRVSSSSYPSLSPEQKIAEFVKRVTSGPSPVWTPDPTRARIVRVREANGHAIVEVIYPDTTNYEGRKFLFYKNTTEKQVRAQADSKHGLDPHFLDNKNFLTPFARFEPTDEGWWAALTLACRL